MEPRLLRRLYVEQRLPLVQVAEILSKLHGCKVSLQWVRRWLHNLDIPVRTLREANRLLLPLAAEQLDELYRKEKLSAESIAHAITYIYKILCSKQTILRALRAAGIPIRTRREVAALAQKYPRLSFDGDLRDQLYYLGYFVGDLHLLRVTAFTMMVTLTTTVPASIRLFRDLFESYGQVKTYSQRNPLTGSYEWHVRAFLSRPSFDFMISKPQRLPRDARGERFYDFLAGYFDAEGAVYITHGYDPRVDVDRIRYRVKIRSGDVHLLKDFFRELQLRKLHPLLVKVEQPGDVRFWNGQVVRTNGELWELSLNRNGEVVDLLRRLPLRNSDKIRWKELIIRCSDRGVRDYRRVENVVRKLRDEIRGEICGCVKSAEDDYKVRQRVSMG